MILRSGALVQYVHGPEDIMFVVLAKATPDDAKVAEIIVGGRRQELPVMAPGGTRGLVLLPDFDTVEAAGLDGGGTLQGTEPFTWNDVTAAQSAQRSAAKDVESALNTMLSFGIRLDRARGVIAQAAGLT